jgi:hypothetical protein
MKSKIRHLKEIPTVATVILCQTASDLRFSKDVRKVIGRNVTLSFQNLGRRFQNLGRSFENSGRNFQNFGKEFSKLQTFSGYHSSLSPSA